MKHTLIIACALTSVIIMGCESAVVRQNITYDLYLAGKASDAPVYWVNGVMKKLVPEEHTGAAYAIAAAGKDILIGGAEGSRPVIWKNGVKQTLTTGTTQGVVKSLCVTPAKIYAAGSVTNGSNTRAMLWEFDTLLTPVTMQAKLLGEGNDWSEAVSVGVLAEAVYVAGSSYIKGYSRAVYWLNGTKRLLPIKGDEAGAAAMCIAGNDIYIGGFIKNTAGKSAAVYWKNGTMTILPDGRSVTALWLYENTFYAAGKGPIDSESKRADTGRFWVGSTAYEQEDAEFVPNAGIGIDNVTYTAGYNAAGGLYYDTKGAHALGADTDVFAIAFIPAASE